MQDFIKRARLLGIGLFYMGKEKVEETIAELIKKGEISEKEGKALVNELVSKSRAATKELEAKISNVMADAQEKLHAPLRKEIDVLRRRIEKLEKRRSAKKEAGPKKAAARDGKIKS